MLARKNYVDNSFSIEEKERQVELKRRMEIKRKNNARRKAKFKIISTSIFSFILAVTVLYGHASIAKMKSELNSLESTRKGLENEKEYLQASLEEIKTISDIEDNAIIKLGMDYPKEDQIVYIDMGTNNVEAKENNKGLINSIFNSIQGLF